MPEFSDEALLYLWTTPASADLGRVTPEEFGERVAETRELPENIRRVLTGKETGRLIQQLTLKKYRLSLEQAQSVSSALGSILRGEEGVPGYAERLQARIGAPRAVTDDIAQVLSREFITPNYFQIAQVYEEKHKTTGSGELGRENRDGRRAPTPSERPTVTEPTTAPRVVDLRNGAIPSRLPPPPRVAPAPTEAELGPPREAPPRGAEGGPPPPTPQTGTEDTRPPPPPPRRGPTPDDLLEKLNSHIPPSPPMVRPPGGGTHGPLPVPPRPGV